MKLAFLSFLPFTTLLAQNMVQNPSMEEGAVCDGTTENIEQVEGWKRIAGSPRLINTACPLNQDAKSYVQGMQLPPAFAGNVYAGLGMDANGEFLQAALTKPLDAGKQYWVKLRVRLPSRFCHAFIKEVGAYFAAEELAVTEDYRRLDVAATALRRVGDKPIDQTLEWAEVSAIYTAKGGENYVTIGNFASTNAEVFKTRKQGECTYLFFDMLSVEEFKAVSLPVFHAGMDLQPEERVWLKGVRFDREKLTKESEAELKALVELLNEHPDWKIEVSGHCDSNQDEAQALHITQQNAQTVVAYLTKKGIAADRLKAVGKGSGQAIAPNSDANAQEKNNRVEIRRW